MAVASLTLGIVSIVFGVFGFGMRLSGIALAVIGIILGAKEKNEERKCVKDLVFAASYWAYAV